MKWESATDSRKMKEMKNRRQIIVMILIAVAVASLATAQSEPAAQKSLAATLGVYVFPTQGQDAAQQSKDEAECYTWAADTTKSDPFNLAKKVQQAEEAAAAKDEAVAEATAGAGAGAAVKGAAVGALIGEIASNDAGEGAAWGAAAGLIGGRRAARRARAATSQQGDRDVERQQQASAEQIEGFKKAFSVCLEAKSYMAKI
jgi:hypothetical protein